MNRKLNKAEQRELEHLQSMKDLYIGEMLGKVNLINEAIKEVRKGTWYERFQNLKKMDDHEQ